MKTFSSLSTLFYVALLGIILALPHLASATPAPAPTPGNPEIEVFVRAGCPHCAAAEKFLTSLQQERPTVTIVLHEISSEPEALTKLQQIAAAQHINTIRVPAFNVAGQLIIGYSDELTTGQLIRQALAGNAVSSTPSATAGSCAAESTQTCDAPNEYLATATQDFSLDFMGYRLTLNDIGLPVFTLAMGLLDGFNPCSIWVLVLMISLLAPMQDRWRMLAVAGTFVLVEGIAYFVFMAAWLNLFLLIGLSRASEIIIACIALFAGGLNLKDFWRFGWGISLSIPNAAKPGIYARIRAILGAQNLAAAMIGATVLAILVQIVEFMCTSGFPALFTRILTLRQLDTVGYYSYLLLYNLAYMFDDLIVLAIGVITLSQHRLQEKEGRWLKLISGLVMVGLGIYLLF